MSGLTTLTLTGLAVVASLYVGKLARRLGLPSLIGYLVVGVLLGGSVLGMFGEHEIAQVSFVTQIALGFVAFTIGSELSVRSMRRLGSGITAIILCESLAAFALVFLAIYLVTGDLALSLIFGAMAPASAPAGTVAVIQEYRARGNLTSALYAVVGFDDGLAILIYGFAAAAARSLLLREATGSSCGVLSSIGSPAAELGLSILLGAALGAVYAVLQRRLRHGHEIPALTFGFVAVAVGLSQQFHLSLILVNMMIGFTLANSNSSAAVRSVAGQLRSVMPLLFILFFFLAGAHLQLGRLAALGAVGIVYIAGRTAGKLSGAWAGSVLGRAGPKLRRYLGLGILSQAGVAIGFSLIASQDLHAIGTDHAIAIGAGVITTITATSIVFEIVGPLAAKIALQKAGEIPADTR